MALSMVTWCHSFSAWYISLYLTALSCEITGSSLGRTPWKGAVCLGLNCPSSFFPSAQMRREALHEVRVASIFRCFPQVQLLLNGEVRLVLDPGGYRQSIDSLFMSAEVLLCAAGLPYTLRPGAFAAVSSGTS